MQKVFCLRHIETREYVCYLRDGYDWIAVFDAGDDALALRADLRAQEHTDLCVSTMDALPFTHFCLNGAYIVREKTAA